MGVYLEFIEYDEDWTKHREKIGELWMSYLWGIKTKGIQEMLSLVTAPSTEYSMPCPYGGYMEILFRDELEELIKKLKEIKVSSHRYKTRKHIIKTLEDVLNYMDEHQLGAVSKEWW